MRRILTLSVATIALVGLTPGNEATPDAVVEASPPATITINILGACQPGEPRVDQQAVTVNGGDQVVWVDPSGLAENWTVQPKTPGFWPFSARSHAGRRGQGASSGQPQRRTPDGDPVNQGDRFAYKITIICPGAPPQIIDPDIIVGEL
jgi:hypothetical protein